MNRILTFLLLGTLAPCLTCPVVAQPQASLSNIRLANDIVRFEFEPKHAGLAAMADLASGLNHIHPVDGKHTLWELTFGHNSERRSLSSTQVPCNSDNVQKLPDGRQRATFEWSGMKLEKEKGVVNVKVTVDLPAHLGIASWRIDVTNDSKTWGLYHIDFPGFNGFLKSGEYDIAVPRRNFGKLYKSCSKSMSYRYPHGWSMPMQFMTACR